ncbi:MAG: hypothetical protein AAFX04_08770 [Pseudomonadota bacterium]
MNSLGFIEMAIFSALMLGFVGWQYWSVSREIAKDKEKAAQKAAEENSEDCAAS